MLTKKQLAIVLSGLKGFSMPHPGLEQYLIPSEIAATILWEMLMHGDIDNKVLADCGAGTGILGLGASLLGAEKVHLIDIDKAALAVAKENHARLEKDFEMKLSVIFHRQATEAFSEPVDVIIQNPPFGAQREHADRIFLEKAFTLAPVVYSFHKIETESFLKAIASDYSYDITQHWFFSWPLAATMKHHTKRKHLVKVGAWRFQKIATS